MTSLKKHVDADLVVIVKKIEEEVNGLIRGIFKKQLVKKKPICVMLCNIYVFY